MERIYKSTQGLSFYLKDGSKHINVFVTVEEFEGGQLIISAKYGDECIGKRDTSIDNSDIVKED